MSLVFAGVCSHAPGITGRAHMADQMFVTVFMMPFGKWVMIFELRSQTL